MITGVNSLNTQKIFTALQFGGFFISGSGAVRLAYVIWNHVVASSNLAYLTKIVGENITHEGFSVTAARCQW